MMYNDKEGREAISTLEKSWKHSPKLHSNGLSVPFWKVTLPFVSGLNTH